jgi:polyhydroxybutyrate depolymerase
MNDDASAADDARGSGGTASSGGATGAGGTTGMGGAQDAGAASVASPGCGKTITRQDAKTQLTLQVGGTTRYYLLYTPTSYDPNTPLPMVFALHGMNMNNWWAANDGSGFKLIEASANKAILVYPQGSGDAPGTTSKWGNINSNWSPGVTGADDKFIDALLASMQENYCVDTSKIFVTGFSMGGWMTENFACDHAKVFRAFAPVAGWGPGDMSTGHGSKPSCSDTSIAVPILITQGTSDTTVTPDNGANSRDFWIARDGCTTTTATMSTSGCVAYQGCKAGLAVDYCTHSGGHMVPSNAGTYIWSFFSSFK